MKNQYMFFDKELFGGFDLNEYKINDICIPDTKVHIYEFSCSESEEYYDDEAKAKMLDKLTVRLKKTYRDAFQIVYSDSSQFFCQQIYPMVVKFETKLRYTIYISTALFQNGNIDKNSFKIGNEQSQKTIEETDFGGIYEALFTDTNLQKKVKEINCAKLTKADLINQIEALEESCMWEEIVGEEYSYIVKHFLEIKKYRNDVMHNHLITYEDYIQGRKTIQKAIDELERVINDKLLVNDSVYSNKFNVMEVLSGIMVLVGAAAMAVNKFAGSETSKNIIKGLEVLGNVIYESNLLISNEEDIAHEHNDDF